MALKLIINNVDKSSIMLAGTFSVSDSLNGRNTCRFSIIDEGFSQSIICGQAVQVGDAVDSTKNSIESIEIDETDISITTGGCTEFYSGDYITIDNEVMKIVNCTSVTSVLTVVRAQMGTPQSTHADDTAERTGTATGCADIGDGRFQLADTSKSWVTNEWVGEKIVIVGTGAGTYTITDNGGNFLRYTASPPTAQCVAGSTYTILSPIYHWDVYFAGTVDDIVIIPYETIADAREFTVNAVDWNQVLDRFLVTQQFTSTTSGEVAIDIINDTGIFQHTASTETLTALEGITASLTTASGQVSSGFTVDNIIFNYLTVTQCLNQLAEISGGYFWTLDYNKDLIFGEFGSTVQTITNANAETYLLSGSVRKSETRDQFRNQQFLRGSMAEADAVTTYHKASVGANGDTVISFLTSRPVSSTFRAYYYNSGWVEYAASVIGVKDMDQDKTIYYEVGSNAIVVTDATDGKQYKFSYKYRYPSIEYSQSGDSIAARKAIEGNSGFYANVETLPDITLESGKERADGLVTQYGTIRSDLTYQSDTISWVAGSKQEITLTPVGITSTIFLIVSRRVYDNDGKNLRATYVLMEGKIRKNWIDWYRKIYESQLRIFNENEVLQMVTEIPNVGSASNATYATLGFSGKVSGASSDANDPVGTANFQIQTRTLNAAGQGGSQNLVAIINFCQVAA